MTDYALAVARAVDPAILAAIPRQPSPPAVTDRHGKNASPKVTAAVAEYRASSKARGELIRIATKHGVHVTAIISRIKREDARTHPTP